MKKAIVMIIPIISMIFITFFFGLKVNEDKFKSFAESGYIISKVFNDQGDYIKSERYYFTEGTKYKKNYSENITFNNANEENVSVEKNSFIHYDSGNLAVLKKSAVLNLDTIRPESSILYYSLNEKTMLTSKNGAYVVKSVEKDMNFSNFIVKIDENKYLLFANKMILTIGNEVKNIENTFFEIEFFEGDIVRIENNEVSLQSVSADVFFKFENELVLNLDNKFISKDNENIVNLNEMTIESSDNIELIEDEEEALVEENKTPDNPLAGMGNGIVNSNAGDSNDEEVNENEKEIDPVFAMTEINVTSNKVQAEVQIIDASNLLFDDIKIKLIEASTNKVIYSTNEMEGTMNLAIEIETLKPETNYILVINSAYKKGGNEYARDFIQKNILTESVGVTIKKNYFSLNNLAFNAVRKGYSDLSSMLVTLVDNIGRDVASQTITFNGLTEVEFNFEGLENNSEYTLKVSNLIYQDAVITESNIKDRKYKTLKMKPTIGSNTFLIDKKNSLFTLKMASSEDPNNGIKSYRYEVYDARDLENPEPVQVIEKQNKASVDVSVDDLNIFRGVPYVFKIVAIFDDNEKEYEYETGFSQVMKMDGVTHPHIIFEEDEVTFESIKGNLTIVDDGGTVSLDGRDIITIVYTDSVGIQKSFRTSGSLNIPFDVNYLRKNETYTISVYAKIDLQDGNPAIDNAFLGSVVVMTKDTDEMQLDYEVDTKNDDTVFKVDAKLTNYNGNDIDLESLTMTGIIFNLYEGKSTSGTLIKEMRKVDRNLAEYVSELKTDYIDNEFIITPEFFGKKNEDLKSEFYTIEVVKAYDYTPYENEIRITNNVVVVKAVEFAPSLPTDVERAVDVKVIRNKDAGEKYRDDLKPETVVGYRIRAKYDNSSKFANFIDYKIINAKTGAKVDEINYEVPSDGTIDYISVWLEDGSAHSMVDADFRRGNNYYFTYTALLDMNFDGTNDKVYPSADSGVVLRSQEQEPKKQSPILKFIPKNSNEDSSTWKYIIKDIDNALTQKKIFYSINDVEKNPIDVSVSSNYQDVVFNDLINGYLKLSFEEALLKSATEVKKIQFINQKFETVYIPTNTRYRVSQEVNRVLIEFPEYSTADIFDRVSGAKVIFTAGSKTITKDYLLLNNGNIIVDYSEIEELINERISVEVQLYYDTGVAGFETNAIVTALQIIDDQKLDNRGQYYYNNTETSFQTSTKPEGSLFNISLSNTNDVMTLNNLHLGTSINLDVIESEKGISYNYENLIPKKLATITTINESNTTFIFDKIIPSVSLMNSKNVLEISPKLISVKYKIELSGDGGNRIRDNKIFVEVYKTDENGTTGEKVNTTEFDIAELDDVIETEGLVPNTNYYAKFFAYVKAGNEYDYEQLYDSDFQTNTKNYYFKSLGDVGIGKITVKYHATSYENRMIDLNYTLRETIGYDRIEYEIYKLITNDDNSTTEELVDLEIENDLIMKPTMKKTIDIPPGCGIETTTNYRVVIRPYSVIETNGVKETIELVPNNDLIFKIGRLSLPFVGMTSAITADSQGVPGIKFKVSFYDKKQTVFNNRYNVEFYNENNERIPTIYDNRTFNTNATSFFNLTGLEQSKRYKMKITYKVNCINGIDTLEDRERFYTSTIIPTNGISIGTLNIQRDPNDSAKVRMIFTDSYKLTEIDKVTYTIYDDTGYSFGKSETFLPITAPLESGITYYYFTLNTLLPEYGKYYFQIQFFKDGQTIQDESMDYDYVE